MWQPETAGLALVAERQGQVVGVIAVAAIPYLEREGRWGRIVALVVSSACRGQGIGRRLVDAAEDLLTAGLRQFLDAGIGCIAGVSKIAYVTATVFRLQWRHES
jgi:predicted N-acetyltransferase YhbS